MKVEWILCALLVGGCDAVWRLDAVHDVTDGDATADGDVDGDADVDALPPGGHDEDADGFPDDEDKCPGIADPSQADADADGVGDACDPSDTTKHMLALFVTFAEMPAKWKTLNGPWTIAGDALAFPPIPDDPYQIIVYTGTLPAPPYVIDYHYKLDDIHGSNDRAFHVIADANATTGAGVGAGHTRHNAGQDVVRLSPNGSAPGEGNMSAPLVVGKGYYVRTTYDRAGHVDCTIKADDGSTMGSRSLDFAAVPAGTLGFRISQMGVHVQYVAIYKQVP